ncbi:MAG: hypothetical protein HY606_03650, partial [Planctomycetes bacterium]|nr:hypothetical protein [Planctomycetota bacterium]
PFIKDIIDEAIHYGVHWKRYHIRIITAAEGFSEKFREYISKKAGLKNMFRDFVNIYGSVELGTMAHETETANIIRNRAMKNKKLFKALFRQATKIPTLAQYHTELTYFEERDGEVYGYGYGSSIPLLRYRLYDSGGVFSFEKMHRICKEYGLDIVKECDSKFTHLPFVYVYERSDFVAILYGIQIYPEFVRHALLHRSLHNIVTGKFTMTTKTDNRFDQYLEINVELQKNIKTAQNISKLIVERVFQLLRVKSSEFKELTNNMSNKELVKIILWDYEYLTYFKVGTKQIWTVKS